VQCVNNASTIAVTNTELVAYCGNSSYCDSASSSVLCDPKLELPPFDQLEPSNQALLTDGGCFLNETLPSGQNLTTTGPLAPWCACLVRDDSADASTEAAFTVLNLLIGTNATTGAALPPANVAAPAACAAAPFVPIKETYLCDRPGLPGGSCSFSGPDNRQGRCPFDKPVGQYNVTLVAGGERRSNVNAQCLDEALQLAGAFLEQPQSAAVCLSNSEFSPGFKPSSCQLQNCPCPDPVSTWL
jgi:hypothetical protein